MKVREVVECWKSDYRSQIEYYTYNSYLAPCKEIIQTFGNREISDIVAEEIKTFLDGLIAEGKSRQTVNLRLIVFHHVFRYAVIHGLIQTNPAQIITLPRNLPKGYRTMPDADTISRIKQTKSQNQFWIMAKCLLFLGCRRGEVLALTKDCIDFNKKIILIEKQIEFHGTRPIVKEKTKTKAGFRSVILPTKLHNDLAEFCNSRKDFLFIDAQGHLLTLTAVCKGWDSLELGVTMHQLRHAYATMLYM